MPSAAGLAFTALCLLLAWLLWRGRDDGGAGLDSRTWLRLRSLLPPLLLLAVLPSGCANERFDSLRLYVSGMSVTQVALQGGRRTQVAPPGCDAYFRAGDTPVFIVGGARGCVDLVAQDPSGAAIDGSLVRLDQAPGAQPLLTLTSRAGGGGAMIAAYDAPEGRSYVGAVDVSDGDRLCAAACDRPDARWWTFRDGGRLEPAAGGETVQLPVRQGIYAALQPNGPDRRIHRFGTIGSSDAAATASPPQSFLFQRGGWRGTGWQVLLIDEGAALRRGDGSVVRPQPTRTVPLPPAGRVHIALLALRGDRLRELRSFTIAHDFEDGAAPQRRFGLTLDTPELVPIGSCTQPLTRLAVSPDQVSTDAFSLAAFGSRPNSVLTSAAAGLPIELYDFCRSTSFAFNAPLDPAANAAAAGRRQLAMQVDRMGVPWLLLLIAFATALLVHAASERHWLTDRLDGQILILAQFLLALRAAIGISGVFADPALDWRLIYADIGTAMVALPAILLAVRSGGKISLSALGAIALYVVLALLALTWWLGPVDRIGQLLALLALAALGLRAAGRLLGEKGRRLSLTRLILDRPPGFWPILLAVIVILRLGLYALGFRERFFGITLSAIYVPLLLVAIAASIAQAEAVDPARRTRLGLLFLAAVGVGAGLVAAVINDIGFALVHVPPIAGIAWWRAVTAERRSDPSAPARWSSRLLWMAPAAGLVIGYVALWALIALTPPPGDSAPLEERVTYAVADRSNDQNWLRLRAVFAPTQVPQIGTQNAAVQLDQSLLLGEFTGRILGRGYLEPVDLGSFRAQATHLSDYLSAVHIMAPFGRLGALAMLLVLAAAAAAAVTGRVPRPAPWPNLAGALALWTLFGAAAYMVLANLLLVPFTGRNIYLLSASSGGDLIEGLGLLLMARIGLGYRKVP